MKIVVSLDVEDYVYQFYQMGADALNKRPEELMAQALFMYAGIVAHDMNRSEEEESD